MISCGICMEAYQTTINCILKHFTVAKAVDIEEFVNDQSMTHGRIF